MTLPALVRQKYCPRRALRGHGMRKCRFFLLKGTTELSLKLSEESGPLLSGKESFGAEKLNPLRIAEDLKNSTITALLAEMFGSTANRKTLMWKDGKETLFVYKKL